MQVVCTNKKSFRGPVFLKHSVDNYRTLNEQLATTLQIMRSNSHQRASILNANKKL